MGLIGRAPGSFSRACLSSSGYVLSRGTINAFRGPGAVTELQSLSPSVSCRLAGTRGTTFALGRPGGQVGWVPAEELWQCRRSSGTVLGQFMAVHWDSLGQRWDSL